MYTVIGLGKFGESIVKRLAEYREDVVSIDLDEKLVDDMKDIANRSIVLDSTDIEALRTVGIQNSKAAVVAIGDDFAASVLTTMNLRELGIPRIIVKALNDSAARALERVGATSTIIPEREMGEHIAMRIRNPSYLELIPCGKDHSIGEIQTPGFLIGKSLAEAELRKTYEVNVIGYESMNGEVNLTPSPDYIFNAKDKLFVSGKSSSIEKISKSK